MSPRSRKLCSRNDLEVGVATLEPPATIPSLSDIIRKRIRSDLTSYRATVARVVAGEQVGESDIVTAYETLERLGLDPSQLEADVSAVREHTRNYDKWEAAVAREPAERARLKEIGAELETIEKRMVELRLEARRLSGTKSMGYVQRCRELASAHAHVLAEDIERAVELRARALRVHAVGRPTS